MSDNRRTSVLIEDGERGSLRLKLTRSPRGGTGRSKAFPEPVLPALDDEAAVRKYGSKLLAALCKENVLRAAMDDALRAGVSEVWPLCFKVEGERAQELELCWETLWEKSQQFLALKPQWPIGRLVDSNELSARTFQAPLRILAVMSAIGVSAHQEWLGLKDAVDLARSRGLPVHVTAVVGEQALLDELHELAAADPSWLKVVALKNQQTIENLLDDPFPHILHFFCHGSVRYGGGQLSLATIGDRAEPGAVARDSVVISLSRLESFVNSRKLWLVTLNCCSGASSVGSTHSLAQTVVAAGAGAALGWRTPVDPADAHTLCRTVYGKFLRDLAGQLVGARLNHIFALELTTLAYVVRDELRANCADEPTSRLRWTLPVLFVGSEPLAIMVTAPEPDDPADLAKLDVSEKDGARISDAVTRLTLQDLADAVEPLSSELQRRSPELVPTEDDETDP